VEQLKGTGLHIAFASRSNVLPCPDFLETSPRCTSGLVNGARGEENQAKKRWPRDPSNEVQHQKGSCLLTEVLQPDLLVGEKGGVDVLATATDIKGEQMTCAKR